MIEKDGTVAFERRPSDGSESAGFVKFLPFLPSPHPPGTVTLQGKVQEILGRRRAAVKPVDPAPRMPLPASGPVNTRDPGATPLGYPYTPLPVVQVALEAELLRSYLGLLGGVDREDKARFLTETFALRVDLARRSAAKTALGSRGQMREHLQEVWGDRQRAPVERRRLICALWSELDVSTTAGREAEAAIGAFVREKLPEGDTEAYTAAELAACPARADGARFAPYAPR